MKILTLLTVLILGGCSCTSADKNLTAKNIECSKLDESNSVPCCLQFMSSRTGSDSKDVVCSPLVAELREDLRERRKMRLFEFCEKRQTFTTCWDKMNSKQ